jgi:hypothetical protein
MLPTCLRSSDCRTYLSYRHRLLCSSNPTSWATPQVPVVANGHRTFGKGRERSLLQIAGRMGLLVRCKRRMLRQQLKSSFALRVPRGTHSASLPLKPPFKVTRNLQWFVFMYSLSSMADLTFPTSGSKENTSVQYLLSNLFFPVRLLCRYMRKH